MAVVPPAAPQTDLETDPRFPSGPWTGFFLQPLLPGRHLMELRLTFRHGAMSGDGRDWVGPFVVRATEGSGLTGPESCGPMRAAVSLWMIAHVPEM